MKFATRTGLIASAFAAGVLAFSYETGGAIAGTTDICHSFYITGKMASGARRSKAEQRARAKWSDKVVSVKGGRWGDWSAARQKHYVCSRAGLYYCEAKAVPCLSRNTTPSGGSQKPIN